MLKMEAHIICEKCGRHEILEPEDILIDNYWGYQNSFCKSNIIKWAKVNGWKIKNTKDGIKCICSDCVDK